MFELAVEFNRIFAGHENAHGEFKITGTKGLKASGKAQTVRSALTIDLWESHLKGETGVGVVPINESSQCTWGAVDIDQYDGLDLETLSGLLPEGLVLCRSKSGGAHIYLFVQTATTASLMRKKLALVARAVGHPNAEIFPKQETIKEGDVGNWINMPYFNAESTTRYCIKSGIPLSAEEFVSYVSESALSVQQLVAFNPEPVYEPEADPEFADAPPCIRHLVKSGFPTGSRNAALFSMGVFARKKYVTGWEDKVFEYNQRFMGPGSYSEVAGIIRSLNKKVYVYKCKEAPLAHHCDKEACAASTYGVQLSIVEEKGKRPNILDSVTCVKCYVPPDHSKDEPYWVFTIDDVDIDVTVDMVRNQNIFSREYLRQYHKVVLPIKDVKWVSAMNDLLATAEIHELAPDAGPEGQLMIHLEDFCTNKAQAKVKEELIIGKPWLDNGRVYFRSGDLMKYLDQQRYRTFKEKEIWTILRRQGAKHHQFTLKGKCVSCWSVDEFSQQTEGFDHEPMENSDEY